MSRQRAALAGLEFFLDDEPLIPEPAPAFDTESLQVATGLGEPAELPPPDPVRPKRRRPLIETVEGVLTATEVLQRFEAQREAWYSEELAPFVEGIQRLLQDERRLSEEMHGLPSTDHREVWQDDGVSDKLAHDPTVRRLHLWQPPVWWMAPIVRRQDTPLNMRLPLAETAAEFARELTEQLPPEWHGKRVVVQLEVETRLYWGGRAPRLLPGGGPERASVWQPCSFRGDGVGFSEDLLYLQRGKAIWLVEPRAAEAPLIRRTLRSGVGLLVAVPLVTLELQEGAFGWVKRQATRVLRWMGVKQGIADRDPTFARRLWDDESYWSAALGLPPPDPDAVHHLEKQGAALVPASRPAVSHVPDKTPCDHHVVLVHGGLSSVRGGFGAWLPEDPAALPPDAGPWQGMHLLNQLCVWRFEHDTFVRVHRNLNQLVDLVERTVIGHQPSGTLVLLAHSRGGNVVRFALPRLRQRWPGWRFYGLTAGSPHQGTGVFRRIGRRWAGVAGAVGWFRDVASGLLDKQQMVDLLMLERALAYDIPPGFRDVEPAGVARMARGQGMPEGLWVWGSEWGPGDANPLQERLWRRFIEDWAGFEADGDGIVPKDSALAGLEDAHDASPVFHTAYFEHEPTVAQIRQRLETLLDRLAA
ncbi:hypothetical protein [Caldimonas brevitalea]|uniref:Alpha/beta hydrolase n=1 Tax=Caldimonas brevitalea TaxID=413882 RepID=A0A0G3BFA5_9BURK|nr:hypothetical protein [Caldimonas brevitalea]AKJ27997.1 hypothetical protein AAW51_1306 [Caldimonas brevitalea]